jgi:hypothetical protein
MRYFEELLESYNRLKKRSFKIEFINEAEEPDDDTILASEQAAEELLASNAQELAQEEPGQGVDSDGNPQMKKVYNNRNPLIVKTPQTGHELKLYMSEKRGPNGAKIANAPTVIKVDVGNQQLGAVADESGKILADFKTKANYKKFLGLFGSGAETGASSGEDAKATQNRIAANQEAQRSQERETIGGFASQLGVELHPQTAESQKKMLDNINAFEATPDDELAQRVKSNANGYVVGSTRQGFEYKLATAQTFQTDADGKIVGRGPINPIIGAEAAESHELLSAALTSDGPDCDAVSNRVGTYKGRIILFSRNGKGSDGGEGLAFQQDKFQELCLREYKKKCPGKNLELSGGRFSSNEKNAIKGTFYEATMNFAQIVFNGVRDGGANFTESVGDMVALIQEKTDILQEIAASQNLDAGTTPDGMWENDVLQEQLTLAETPAAIIQFLRKELRAVMPVVQMMDADNVRQAGKVSTTGDRADMVFEYSDKAKADAAAAASGGKVRTIRESVNGQVIERYEVGMGLKRLEKLKKFKMGEINSLARLIQGVRGEIPQSDAAWYPGFNRALDDMHPLSDEDAEGMRAYASELEAGYQSDIDLLTKPSTYEFEGESTTVQPADRFARIADNLEGKVPRDVLLASPIGKAIYRGQELVDFSDPSEQSRAAELFARDRMVKKLRRDLQSDDPVVRRNARNHAIRTAMVTGANADSLSQTITDDTGSTVMLNHNEVFEDITKSDTIIEQDGFTTKFFSPDGRLLLRTGHERTMAGDKAETRITTNMPGDEATRRAKPVVTPAVEEPQVEQQDLLLAFFTGQQKLLETILNQTRTKNLL